MANWKKLAQGAAGAAGGDIILPEAVSFDGTSDYLNRTSTLSGATANKTITASFWYYEKKPISGNPSYGIFSGIEGFNSFSFNMYLDGSDIKFYGAVDNSGIDFGWTLSRRASLKGQWNHVCFSFDLSDSSKRHVYINDKNYSTTVTWDAYTNGNLNWANCSKWSIAATSYSYGAKLKGRLANLFLDNSYIDLSLESNRREFITEDLKPALIESSVDTYSVAEFYVGSQESTPHGMALSDDGYHLVVTGGNKISRYDLSTAWDISTASYVDNLSVSAKEGSTRGVQFNNDGTKLYVLGWDSDALHQYTMSTAYDVSTAVFSTTLSSVASLLPYEVRFKPDGTKLYVLDAFNDAFYQWSLSTAWDISTASSKTANDLGTTLDGAFYISSDGTKIYAEGGGSLKELTMSTAWDISTLSFTSNASNSSISLTNLVAMYTNSDGTKLYTLDGYSSGTDTITQYTMSGYDIETAVPAVVSGGSVTPLIYLPMTDAGTAGDNSGTGGGFTVNGTLDTAQRGPNQFNCSASEFDGSNDYLSKTISTVDGSVLTCSFIFRQDATSAVSFNAYDGGAASASTQVQNANYANPFRVILRNTSGSQICSLESSFRVPQYSQASVQVSLDISNSSDRKVQMFLNGVEDTSVSKTFYTSDTTFRLGNNTYINGGGGAEYFDGSMGEFYLDTAYIDLSSDNPFWDSDANLPKPLRQVLDETGNTPLIALPMNANNPVDNLGTLSDYGQSGGVFASSRGGSEFWARSIEQTAIGGGGGSSNYLSLTNPLTSSEAELTIVAAAKTLDTTINSDSAIVEIGNTGNGLIGSSSETLKFQIGNSNSVVSSTLFNVQDWYVFGASLDTNQTLAEVYDLVDGTLLDDDTANFSSPVDLSGGTIRILAGDVYSQFKGNVGFVYITTDYIDFSQEATRHLFVDQLGYPKDLTAAIAAGDIPTPLVYMKFDDPSDLGANSGTGGDFTVNGSGVKSGSDVNPA